MAGIRKFRNFRKLPIELRLKIWGMVVDVPRVIRAEWELAGYGKSCYHLFGGPVPGVLGANHESRNEALRKYTLVKNRLQSTKPLKGEKAKAGAVYVNFDVDTLYITKLPELFGFLNWLRRLQDKRSRGGETTSKVTHLAMDEGLFGGLFDRAKLQHLVYTICMDCELQSITILQDGSKFSETKQPHLYSILPLKEVDPRIPSNDFWIRHRQRLQRIAGELFPDSQENTLQFIETAASREAKDKFKKFREEHPDWKAPSMPVMTILKQRIR